MAKTAQFSEIGLWCGMITRPRMQDSHRHNEIELNLPLGDAVTYFFGARARSIEPGVFAVFWGAVPHQLVQCAAETEFHVATVPLAWLLQWNLPEAFVKGLLEGQILESRNQEAAAADRLRFQGWARLLAGGGEERQRIVLLEMQARLLALALEGPAPAPRRRPSAPPDAALGHAEAMVRAMAKGYARPLTVRAIAAAAGLHPNYAMAVFKAQCGLSLLEYLTRLRISHAQRRLLTSNDKILAIALESGFGSLSRFYAAFERQCGTSPRRYRLAARGR